MAMAMARWSKANLSTMATLGGFFVAVGAGYGLWRDGEIIFGIVAGGLLFGLVIGVGALAEWIGGGRR
jgi:hypothetical protein